MKITNKMRGDRIHNLVELTTWLHEYRIPHKVLASVDKSSFTVQFAVEDIPVFRHVDIPKFKDKYPADQEEASPRMCSCGIESRLIDVVFNVFNGRPCRVVVVDVHHVTGECEIVYSSDFDFVRMSWERRYSWIYLFPHYRTKDGEVDNDCVCVNGGCRNSDTVPIHSRYV